MSTCRTKQERCKNTFSIQTLPNRIHFAPPWENAREIRENGVVCENFYLQHCAEPHWDEAFPAHAFISNTIPLTGQVHLLYIGEENIQSTHRNPATAARPLLFIQWTQRCEEAALLKSVLVFISFSHLKLGLKQENNTGNPFLGEKKSPVECVVHYFLQLLHMRGLASLSRAAEMWAAYPPF